MKTLQQSELATLLRAMARLVEAGDSFEGNLSYSCMDDGLAPGEFAVRAQFRTGNSEGQGGMVVVGDPAHADAEVPAAAEEAQTAAADSGSGDAATPWQPIDIPVPGAAEHWGVSVRIDGQALLDLEHLGLSCQAQLSERDRATIISCAHMLLSFVSGGIICTRGETTARRRGNAIFDPGIFALDPGELNRLMRELVIGKLEALYSRQEAEAWIVAPHELLDGATPVALIETGRTGDVLRLIRQLLDGSYT